MAGHDWIAEVLLGASLAAVTVQHASSDPFEHAFKRKAAALSYIEYSNVCEIMLCRPSSYKFWSAAAEDIEMTGSSRQAGKRKATSRNGRAILHPYALAFPDLPEATFRFLELASAWGAGVFLAVEALGFFGAGSSSSSSSTSYWSMSMSSSSSSLMRVWSGSALDPFLALDWRAMAAGAGCGLCEAMAASLAARGRSWRRVRSCLILLNSFLKIAL